MPYFQDKTGQWWQQGKTGVRIKATIRECETCNKEIIRPAKIRNRPVYCSAICLQKYQDLPIIDRHGKYFKDSEGQWWFPSPRGGKGRIRSGLLTCLHCRKEFPRIRAQSSRNKQNLCSIKCRNIYLAFKNRTNANVYKSIRLSNGKRILEHRYIMEQHLGRKLFREETVHHENGMRRDNRLQNLELWTTRHPKGSRIRDLTKWAKEHLKIYEPESLAQA